MYLSPLICVIKVSEIWPEEEHEDTREAGSNSPTLTRSKMTSPRSKRGRNGERLIQIVIPRRKVMRNLHKVDPRNH